MFPFAIFCDFDNQTNSNKLAAIDHSLKHLCVTKTCCGSRGFLLCNFAISGFSRNLDIKTLKVIY